MTKYIGIRQRVTDFIEQRPLFVVGDFRPDDVLFTARCHLLLKIDPPLDAPPLFNQHKIMIGC